VVENWWKIGCIECQ